MPLVTAGALSNGLKTAPSKPRAVKSNALIPARLFICPPLSVEAPPPTLHAPYVLKNTFHYTLQLELAAMRRTLGLTRQHREIVDGSNPSQRVQGLHSHPAFHGHTPRSPSPICPRPSTSVIRLAIMFVTVHYAPTVRVPFQRTTAQKSGISSAISKKYGESPTQSVFYVEQRCKYT